MTNSVWHVIDSLRSSARSHALPYRPGCERHRKRKYFHLRPYILFFDRTYLLQRSFHHTQRITMAKSGNPKRFERTAKGRRFLRQRSQMRRASQNSASTPNYNTGAGENEKSGARVDQSHPFFRKLPIELRSSILELLPYGDLGSLRQTCQEFKEEVEVFGVVQRETDHHLNRLQTSIDVINAARMPTDADTLLASMRIWTSTRGIFRIPILNLESWSKWFSHLANGDVREKPWIGRKPFQQWAFLATIATALQLRVNQSSADHSLVIIGSDGSDILWRWFQDESTRHPIPLDADELRKLYYRIRHAPRNDRAIVGAVHGVKLEKTTFPGSQSQIGRKLLTPIRYIVGQDPNRRKSTKNPMRPTNIMLANMDLPDLPPHDTFCYYTTNKVKYDKISRTFPGPLEMTPWMRAAALASVGLF